MCPPVMAAAAAAMASIGTVVGGIAAKNMGNYQKKVADQNAKFVRENIQLEQEAGRREALLHYRKVAQLKGQQRAVAAANGVSTDFGTAGDLIDDTDMMAREDAANIYGQTFQNVRGMDRQAANFTSEGRAAKARGRNAFIGSLFQAGSTALGGAQQYSKMKADYGSVPKGKGKGSGKSAWWAGY